MGTLLFVVVLAVLLGGPILIYNRLVGARNVYRNAFAQIDVQLTRRYDLIPNLVETAKGYLAHERGTLEAVISARNAAVAGLKSAAAAPGYTLFMSPPAGLQILVDRDRHLLWSAHCGGDADERSDRCR